jgi:cellulose synthase/poly-beta-1,6-N-acetylglucosamine synthase-like glycosyltransferase
VIRAYALRTVSQARGQLIPGSKGQVYDTLALTEDNELTLALKSLGARLTSPPQCHVTTEIMPTWRALWRQRSRWHRGALENIGAYGLTRATAIYWVQQIGLSYGVLALFSFLLLTAITLLAADDIQWSPFWLGIGAIFLVERVVTAWRAGWRGRILAAPVFLELGYAVFLQVTFLYSMGEILVGRKSEWNYVPRPAANAVVPLAALSMLPAGILLPASVLSTSWYEGLAIWVGFNTLVFAALSLLQLLPPLRRRRP